MSLLAFTQIPSFQWARQSRGVIGETFVRGNSVVVDDSGNVYSTGNFMGKVDFDSTSHSNKIISSSRLDIYVTKLDAAGN